MENLARNASLAESHRPSTSNSLDGCGIRNMSLSRRDASLIKDISHKVPSLADGSIIICAAALASTRIAFCQSLSSTRRRAAPKCSPGKPSATSGASNSSASASNRSISYVRSLAKFLYMSAEGTHIFFPAALVFDSSGGFERSKIKREAWSLLASNRGQDVTEQLFSSLGPLCVLPGSVTSSQSIAGGYEHRHRQERENSNCHETRSGRPTDLAAEGLLKRSDNKKRPGPPC